MESERYSKLTSIVNQTIIDFWKSCNGVRKVTELVDWATFAADRGLTDEEIEEHWNYQNKYNPHNIKTRTELRELHDKSLTDEQIEEGEDIIGN